MTLDPFFVKPKYLEIGEREKRSRFERIKELQIRTCTSLKRFYIPRYSGEFLRDSNKIYTENDGIISVKSKTCSSRADRATRKNEWNSTK